VPQLAPQDSASPACPNGGLAAEAFAALNTAYDTLRAIENVVDVVADECVAPYIRPGNASALALARQLEEQEAKLAVVGGQLAVARRALTGPAPVEVAHG
jgi:hypothetical protein